MPSRGPMALPLRAPPTEPGKSEATAQTASLLARGRPASPPDSGTPHTCPAHPPPVPARAQDVPRRVRPVGSGHVSWTRPRALPGLPSNVPALSLLPSTLFSPPPPHSSCCGNYFVCLLVSGLTSVSLVARDEVHGGWDIAPARGCCAPRVTHCLLNERMNEESISPSVRQSPLAVLGPGHSADSQALRGAGPRPGRGREGLSRRSRREGLGGLQRGAHGSLPPTHTEAAGAGRAGWACCPGGHLHCSTCPSRWPDPDVSVPLPPRSQTLPAWWGVWSAPCPRPGPDPCPGPVPALLTQQQELQLPTVPFLLLQEDPVDLLVDAGGRLLILRQAPRAAAPGQRAGHGGGLSGHEAAWPRPPR